MDLLRNFFSNQNLFGFAPFGRFDWLTLAVAVAALALAAVLKLSAKMSENPVDREARARFGALFLFLGVWQAVWFALRFQNIRFFGSRFVSLLGMLAALAWLAAAVWKLRGYGQKKRDWDKEQLRQKYLPK